MTTTAEPAARGTDVRLPYDGLLDLATAVFAARGMPRARASAAAEALLYGDVTGMRSHGLVNLTRLYLPLFDDNRADPAADLEIVADRRAAVLVDARRSLGLWAAGEAMDMAVARSAEYGVGMVSVRGGTHFGCAGHHTRRAVRQGAVGVLLSNCGRQRIARPPGGRSAMLGTNPLSVAAPAGPGLPPFVLDMSTTAVPTGKVREAARAGRGIPEGWLQDASGQPVTDPAALDRGEGFLMWLGGRPETGAFKGYGLALVVEVLAALVAGAGLGPAPEAFGGDGSPTGRDDDIGFLALAVQPAALRPREDFLSDAAGMFQSLLDCPPLQAGSPVGYPGTREAAYEEDARRHGVAVSEALYAELGEVAETIGARAPRVVAP
ncbi:Ldh family oxidoreductase [Streptomyces sp. Go-475]|uniref:Ldh family oxidoreductase n=1 Tax=Streptomyces sp. Go-475 TaxID=2072505 RepID=UPI000DF01A46|nr:Ldh family oxidoreductase [Streptomyces sp. Go-475]AXE88768.1 putative oxidoreductase YjmC [Streptomyces sp. Go-475]